MRLVCILIMRIQYSKRRLEVHLANTSPRKESLTHSGSWYQQTKASQTSFLTAASIPSAALMQLSSKSMAVLPENIGRSISRRRSDFFVWRLIFKRVDGQWLLMKSGELMPAIFSVRQWINLFEFIKIFILVTFPPVKVGLSYWCTNRIALVYPF